MNPWGQGMVSAASRLLALQASPCQENDEASRYVLGYLTCSHPLRPHSTAESRDPSGPILPLSNNTSLLKNKACVCVRPAALSVCPGERSGAGAVLQPREAAAGEGGGGGLAVEPLQGSFLTAASPKRLPETPPRNPSPSSAAPRSSQLTAGRRSCGAAGPRGVSARCVAPYRAEPRRRDSSCPPPGAGAARSAGHVGAAGCGRDVAPPRVAKRARTAAVLVTGKEGRVCKSPGDERERSGRAQLPPRRGRSWCWVSRRFLGSPRRLR